MLHRLEQFNDTSETIICISNLQTHTVVITAHEEFDGNGKLECFTLFGYVLNVCDTQITSGFSIARLDCEMEYYDRFNNIHIIDFTVAEKWQNNGIGSLMLKRLIYEAEQMKIMQITGWLSPEDIGRDGNTEKKKNRERLYHFYSKHGFFIDENKNIHLRLNTRQSEKS